MIFFFAILKITAQLGVEIESHREGFQQRFHPGSYNWFLQIVSSLFDHVLGNQLASLFGIEIFGFAEPF